MGCAGAVERSNGVARVGGALRDHETCVVRKVIVPSASGEGWVQSISQLGAHECWNIAAATYSPTPSGSPAPRPAPPSALRVPKLLMRMAPMMCSISGARMRTGVVVRSPARSRSATLRTSSRADGERAVQPSSSVASACGVSATTSAARTMSSQYLASDAMQCVRSAASSSPPPPRLLLLLRAGGAGPGSASTIRLSSGLSCAGSHGHSGA
eukprot:5736581-Prymnesium_polylepis.2